MTYVIGAAVGLAVGALAAWIKYLLLWKPMLNGKRELNMKNIGIMQGGSMFLNIAVILGIFFARNLWPYSFEATIIASALGLSLFSRLSPLRELTKLDADQNTSTESAEETAND